jgi:AcrR family transcriptional regulator
MMHMRNTARERIIEAASELFASKGYTASTTREIARTAGTDESTLFRQFGSKLALAGAVLSAGLQPLTREMSRDTLARFDLAMAAELYAMWYLQRFNRRLIRLWTTLAVEAPAAFEIPLMPAHVAMTEIVREAQAAGQVVAGNPRSILRALHSALVGHATLRALRHPIADHDSLLEDDIAAIVQIWLRGIASHI